MQLTIKRSLQLTQNEIGGVSFVILTDTRTKISFTVLGIHNQLPTISRCHYFY